MSIIYNGQTVAGVYAEQILNNADTINAGIIKIATQEEVDTGENNTSAVTPLYLSNKQNKLESGDNISIENDIISCDIKPDVSTIIQNEDGTLTNIGQLTKSGTIKIDWEGTEAEYTRAMLNGEIQPDWYCYITDDESIVDYEGSTKLDFNQITNCITEIPQNIKLELNNGVLTLKKGSKIIVPNGSGVFDEVVVTQDKSVTYAWTPSRDMQCMMFLDVNGGVSGAYFREISTCLSGATTPSITNYTWYDTANNVIKTHNGVQQSFPIAIITQGNGVTKSIDQVFNGFGYIGSTVWVDKGVKWLAPDGRNADGTLNNRVCTSTTIKIRQNPIADRLGYFRLTADGLPVDMNKGRYFEQEETPTSTYAIWYKPSENIMYYCRGDGVWGKSINIYLGAATADTNGNITSFNPKQPFRAVDYNEYKGEVDNKVSKSGDTMTGTLKLNTSNPIQVKTGIDTTVTPTNNRYSMIEFVDKNNVRVGILGATQDVNGYYGVYMQAGNIGSIHLKTNGTSSYSSAPTPATGDNSTKIATTAFVNTLVPAGTVILSADTDTPAGYLYCNGSAVSRTTYKNLYNAIGTTYGTGDGSTTFNLPNYSTYKFVTSGTVSVKGNGKTIGLTDGTNNAGLVARNTQNAIIMTGVFNTAYGTSASGSQLATNTSFGVTTDATKSGITGSIGTGAIKMYIKY